MSEDLSRRQQAVRLRLAHVSVVFICATLQCAKSWFYKWWSRYQECGAEGLHDASRAPHTSPHQIPDEIRQLVLAIRDRLARRRGPKGRYRFIGAPTIQDELKGLGGTPLPALRSIELILHQAGRTNPPMRFNPPCPAPTYPRLQAMRSNQVHEFDLVGPRYLKGRHTRYYFLAYKDVFDQAVYIEFCSAPSLSDVLDFVVRAWQHLGVPHHLSGQ